MKVKNINSYETENQVKSKIWNSKSPEGNSSYLQFNESTDNDRTKLQTELNLSTNDKDVTKKSNIEISNQSKSLSIIKDETINTDVSDSSKLPSLNNQSKSNKELTINHDKQVHPNIERNTDPKTDIIIQDTDNSDKSKISNSKSPKGNSSYLQFNESIDNENTEVQTELKLPTNEEDVTKKSDIEKPNHSPTVLKQHSCTLVATVDALYVLADSHSKNPTSLAQILEAKIGPSLGSMIDETRDFTKTPRKALPTQ